MKTFIEEFKAFAIKGNVVDLAVAVVIGGAFGKIVSSLVDTIIMPIVGVILGGVDFTGWSFKVGDSIIAYGKFVQSVVDFFIIALVIFTVLHFIRSLEKGKEKEIKVEPEPKPNEEVILLQEIRDLLKDRE